MAKLMTSTVLQYIHTSFAFCSQHSQGLHWRPGWEWPPSSLLQEALYRRRDRGHQDLQLCPQDSGKKTQGFFLSVMHGNRLKLKCLILLLLLQHLPCSHGGRIHLIKVSSLPLIACYISSSISLSPCPRDRLDQSEPSGLILVCSQKHGWTSCLSACSAKEVSLYDPVYDTALSIFS